MPIVGENNKGLFANLSHNTWSLWLPLKESKVRWLKSDGLVVTEYNALSYVTNPNWCQVASSRLTQWEDQMSKLHHWVGIWRRTDQDREDVSCCVFRNKYFGWDFKISSVDSGVLRAFDRSAKYFPKPLVYPELVEWEIDDESTGI